MKKRFAAGMVLGALGTTALLNKEKTKKLIKKFKK